MLAFNFHIGDFTKKTMHLTHEERGIYLSLLMRYYDTESPLPADQEAVCRLACARSADAKRTVCDVLAEFFELHDDGWRNARADEEINAYQSKRAKARNSAKARWGGASKTKRAKKEGEESHSEGNADAMRTHSEGNANHEPRTTNHNTNPLHHSGDGGLDESPPPAKGPSQGEIDDAFEVYWSAGMRKVGKKAARKSFASAVKRLKVDPGDFARQLADDVRARLAAKQMGFDLMHPTTYLNGERWNDQICHDDARSSGARLSPMEEFERARRERDAQEAGGGLGMGEDDRAVRGELDTRAGEGSFIDLDSSDWQTRRG